MFNLCEETNTQPTFCYKQWKEIKIMNRITTELLLLLSKVLANICKLEALVILGT